MRLIRHATPKVASDAREAPCIFNGSEDGNLSDFLGKSFGWQGMIGADNLRLLRESRNLVAMPRTAGSESSHCYIDYDTPQCRGSSNILNVSGAFRIISQLRNRVLVNIR